MKVQEVALQLQTICGGDDPSVGWDDAMHEENGVGRETVFDNFKILLQKIVIRALSMLQVRFPAISFDF